MGVGHITQTIRLHGHHFAVTGTDAGWVPDSAQRPEATVDLPVGTLRTIEFVADNPGDWALHCHKTHHAMNAMGHNVKNFIGVQRRDLAAQIRKIVPDYHPMGTAGMADMGAMEMAMPDNTLPMMTGFGQFGPIEMGGMFTVMKIRQGLAANDYKDPGDYQHPKGTVAYEVADASASAPRSAGAAEQPNVAPKAVKPGNNHRGH